MNAPENIDWMQAVTYDVTIRGNMHPTETWLIRRVQMKGLALYTDVFGPFTGAAGGAVARTIANGLNHYCRGDTTWDQLTYQERDFILARQNDPELAAIDDDEIPF